MNAVLQSVAEFYRSSGSVNSPSYFVPESLDQHLEPCSSSCPDKSKAAPQKLEFHSYRKRIWVIIFYVIQALFQLYSVLSLLPFASLANQKEVSIALGVEKPSENLISHNTRFEFSNRTTGHYQYIFQLNLFKTRLFFLKKKHSTANWLFFAH